MYCFLQALDDENTEDYFQRLKTVFDRCSGLTEPGPPAEGQPPQQDMSAYEDYLKTFFLDGLDPEIGEKVKTSCVAYHYAHLKEIRRHATHHQQLLRDKAKEKQRKTDKDTQLLLKMLVLMMENHQGGVRGERGKGKRGRGGRGMGYRPTMDPEACFNCKQMGHWRNDCPYRPKQRGFSPQQ